MTYAMLKYTLTAVLVTVVAAEARGAAQPPTGSPRAVNPMAALDSHVTRHPKVKTSTARVKPAAAGAQASVSGKAPLMTPVPAPLRRPKPTSRPAPPAT